jgi:hypothetical protein
VTYRATGCQHNDRIGGGEGFQGLGFQGAAAIILHSENSDFDIEPGNFQSVTCWWG